MPAGKRLLRLNWDETAVRCFYTCSKGLRPCRAEAAQTPALRSAAENASRRWQRMGLTRVGLICDGEEVQLRLPQVILASDKAVLKRDATLLEARLRRNVYFVRGKTGWITSATLASILELLGRVLAADGGQWQPVLPMDALPSHYSDRVLRAASRAGVWVIIVPAHTMHLRQPLDTEAFLPGKRFLRARYAETRVDDAIGRVRMRDVVDAVNAACGAVLQGRPCSGTFETTTLLLLLLPPPQPLVLATATHAATASPRDAPPVLSRPSVPARPIAGATAGPAESRDRQSRRHRQSWHGRLHHAALRVCCFCCCLSRRFVVFNCCLLFAVLVLVLCLLFLLAVSFS